LRPGISVESLANAADNATRVAACGAGKVSHSIPTPGKRKPFGRSSSSKARNLDEHNALISDSVVVQIGFEPPDGSTIAECFNPALTWVDYSTANPAPHVGDTATEVVRREAPSHPAEMFLVNEAAAAAIRAVYEQEGELSAVIEMRRLFPGITNNEKARECARTIAGWKPLPREAAKRIAVRSNHSVKEGEKGSSNR
jgi:hypothetical protein